MIFLILSLACVSPDRAVEYTERAFPECTDHQYLSHHYGQGGNPAQTEVSMTCDGLTKSVTVKCVHGYGCISKTTCHINN